MAFTLISMGKFALHYEQIEVRARSRKLSQKSKLVCQGTTVQ